MTRGFIDATSAQSQYAEVARRQQLRKQVAQNSTQQIADAIGNSYNSAPWADPGVHQALAQANAPGNVADALYGVAANKAAAESDITAKPKQSWWERNVYGKIKSGSRWLFAATQTVPDLAQNAFSDLFDSGPEQGGTGWASSISGWWHSTSLGTMMSDQDKAGSGFFAGEQLRETQAERARRYRGEINGHAFTIGRGAARFVAPQDSLVHRLLSGSVDAVTNILTDPTNAAGKAIKEFKLAKTAIDVAPETAMAAARLAAGVGSTADEITWNESKVVNWLKSNEKFKTLRNLIAAETSPSEIMKIYGDKLPPEIALALANETDPTKIEQMFVAAASKLGVDGAEDDAVRAVFGDLPGGVVPTNLRAYNTGQKGFFRSYVESKPFGQRMTRWFETAPKQRLMLNGTVEDRTRAVENMRSAINTIGPNVSAARKKELLDKFVVAYAGGVKRDYAKAHFAFDEYIREVLKASDVSDDVIDAVIAGEKKSKDTLRAYFIDQAGKHQDGGMLEALIRGGFIDESQLYEIMGGAYKDPSQLRFVGPTAYIDFLDKVQILPDMRRIRRLTANPFVRRTIQKAYATSEGKQNAISGFADVLQNEVWKTSALATVGYMVRNIFDGQIRMSLKYSGGYGKEIKTMFTKPTDYILWMMRRRGTGTILGNDFFDNPASILDNATRDAAISEHAAQANNAVSAAIQDQPSVLDNVVSTNDFSTIQYSPENAETFVTGVVQQLSHYQNDMIARMVMEGKTTTEIVDALMSEGAQNVKKSLLDNLKSGLRFTDQHELRWVDETGQRASLPVQINNANDEREVLKIIVDKRYRTALDPFMQPGNEELRVAFLTGNAASGSTDILTAEQLDSMASISGEKNIGSVFSTDTTDGEAFFAISDITPDPTTGEVRYTVHRLSPGAAFDGEGMRGSDVMRASVKRAIDNGGMPKWTIYENFVSQTENKNKALDATLSGWKKLNRFFFQNVSAKAMRRFEKDPFYRQFYFSFVEDNVDLLSPTEARKVLDNITRMATEQGVKETRVATKDLIKKLESHAASDSTSIGTARQLNETAARYATDRMAEVLFDAAAKNNLEDAMRIAAPFGAAWREVMQKYVKLVAEDPTAIVRAQRVYNGLNEAEIFGQNGVFYKDPVTGEMMFTFPLSGELIKLVSGGKLDTKMIAPVKRLTMGFNVMPGLGPVGQMAASKFFESVGDRPQFDEIRQILLPYGKPKAIADQIVPQWLQRAGEAWTANKLNSDSIYATTYIDVLRALSTNGKYDLSTEDGKNQLMDDAKQQARFMTGFKALSQFLGPTSGTPTYRIKTKAMEENFKGQDVYGGELVKAFQELQAKNYDTAVGEFLRLYGDEAQLYLSSKTKAIYGGLEASDEFSNFERNNSEFFNRYKDVAGYFAPKGSEFSFAAWDRQIRSGKRERLSDVEILQTAQNAIGSYKYRQLRLQFGSYPNDLQRSWLKTQRELLAKQYPGFPAKAVFVVGELENKIEKLRQAAQYKGIKDLPVTQAINDYLDSREEAMAAAEVNGISFAQSKAAQPLRDWLLARANELISQVPEFGRVFDRELAAEIED